MSVCSTHQHSDSERTVLLVDQTEIKLISSTLLYTADVIVLHMSARVTVQCGLTGNSLETGCNNWHAVLEMIRKNNQRRSKC